MNTTDFCPWLGVFETVRVVNGRPLFLDEHEARLRDAAAALGLNVTASFAKRVDYLQNQSGRWRWVVNRDGTYDFFYPENRQLPVSFTLLIAPQRIGSKNWDARYKTFSYLTHAQARQWALDNGADEAVLLNENGVVATAAMANIFWSKKSKIFTPALDAGCRNGVIRQWILKNEKVEQGIFQPEELAKADEIFVTNSMIGIMPVLNLAGRKLRPGSIVPKLKKLHDKSLLPAAERKNLS